MTITFLGASGTVTGSKYLLELDQHKIMVDCGLFQGLKELRLLNWDEPSFKAGDVNAVLLTHAHLDHCGYLPRLVRMGFHGKVYASEPTIELVRCILEDSARIQEEEAQRANQQGYSRHHPALPLYTVQDAKDTMQLFQPVKEGEWITINPSVTARFQYNGHIIGSTFIEVEAGGLRFVFSGDIGRQNDWLLYPPKRPSRADVLFIESTYGGANHPPADSIVQTLCDDVVKTVQAGGSVFIPSFAVERAQLVMVLLARLRKQGRIPKIPMILDSPMGREVLSVFDHTMQWHRLSKEECEELQTMFTIVTEYRQTMEWRNYPHPMIVIAGSGMLTGGRMLNYLETRASDPNNLLLFVGYQAEGTRGRKLLEGDRDMKIYGATVRCNMQLDRIEGLSAHADQDGLLDWISEIKETPRHIFIVHGEKAQSESLQRAMLSARNWKAELPSLGMRVDI